VERLDQSISPSPDQYIPDGDADERKISVKGTSYRAKDDIFGGKSVARTAVPSARDSGIIHTRLVQKKSTMGTGDEIEGKSLLEPATEKSHEAEKKRKITTKKDDISWI
jgi:hypothetical protein